MPSIQITPWDQPDLFRYTLRNSQGLELVVSNLGCALLELWLPDKEGQFDDVLLGFDSSKEYQQTPYVGTILGRVANRLSSRQIPIGDKMYDFDSNDLANQCHLHGGKEGLHSQIWTAHIPDANSASIQFTLHSKAGIYPGNVLLEHYIHLTENNEMILEFHATSDAATLLNLSNHAYYNLAGHNSGTIEEHTLELKANEITELNEQSLPTGQLVKVKDSPYDFRVAKKIGSQMILLDEKKLDINYVLPDISSTGLRSVGTLKDPQSGRTMVVQTTQPGVQAYNAHFFKNIQGKNSSLYPQYSGLCLETQHFPDSPRHPHFPSIHLGANEKYYQKTIHKFSLT